MKANAKKTEKPKKKRRSELLIYRNTMSIWGYYCNQKYTAFERLNLSFKVLRKCKSKHQKGIQRKIVSHKHNNQPFKKTKKKKQSSATPSIQKYVQTQFFPVRRYKSKILKQLAFLTKIWDNSLLFANDYFTTGSKFVVNTKHLVSLLFFPFIG